MLFSGELPSSPIHGFIELSLNVQVAQSWADLDLQVKAGLSAWQTVPFAQAHPGHLPPSEAPGT